jgi:hypothetical protein
VFFFFLFFSYVLFVHSCCCRGVLQVNEQKFVGPSYLRKKD